MSRSAAKARQLRDVAQICEVQRADAEQQHLLRVAGSLEAEAVYDNARDALAEAAGAWRAASERGLFDPGLTRMWSVTVQDRRSAVAGAERQFREAIAVQAEAAGRMREAILRSRVVKQLVSETRKAIAREIEEAALARSADQHAWRRLAI